MIYYFDNIKVNTEEVTLIKEGLLIDIEPKLFTLLIFFCENSHRALSRDELINTVWEGRVVSEAAVNRAVGQLRKIIERDTAKPLYLKTVSKVGYQFIAEVKKITSEMTEDMVTKSSVTQSVTTTKPSNNSRKTIVKYRFTFIISFLFLVSFSIIYIFSKSSHIEYLPPVEITQKNPITTTNNSTFNPYFDPLTHDTFVLYKPDPQSFAQIKKLNSQGQSLPVTDDSYYYTDVIPHDDTNLLAARLNNLNERECEIVLINIATQLIKTITHCGQSIINNLVFNSDTNTVYYRYRSKVSHPYSIYSISLSSLRIQQLTIPGATSNGLGYTAFELSPDKQQIAMIEYKSEDTDQLQLYDLNTQEIIQHQNVPKDIRSIIWWRSKQLLASNSEGLLNIDLSQQLTTKVKSTIGFGRLSKKSDHALLFEKSDSQSNLVKIELTHFNQTQLTNLIGVNGKSAMAHTSERIIFFSQTPLTSKVLIRLESGEIVETHFPEKIRHLTTLEWSKDDSKIVASINDKIYLLNINSMQWNRVYFDFNNVHYVSFIGNQHLLFSAEKNGNWNLWSLNLTTKETAIMTNTEGYSGQVENGYLFYTKFSSKGIFYKEISAEKEFVLVKDIPVTDWNNWQVNSNNLTYQQGGKLKQYNLKSKETSILYEFSEKPLQYCRTDTHFEAIICELKERSVSNIWQADF
ncbi:winged helix-turn-helix domain-containing protein [Shewanella polaris]|uniref:OmpR/PhoB-type domain-containing protein n=1 Tax=Shewanella polaris TaxID=2588449 RepID=A0A4Y5YHW0_9GAMM|nr:winged helix-turn-helix domain-containing protein [Shewanella polaris]QDE32079.1 hypothetical protein FH971_14580 [Shewanella polaris]